MLNFKFNDFIIFLKKKFDPINVSDEEILLIAEIITKKNRTDLIVCNNIEFTNQDIKNLENLIYKINVEKMPIQYIIGKINFINVELFVETPILIPRTETEYWCFELIKKLLNLSNKKIKILDVGTGSGCIAIAIAKFLPESEVFAIDISDKALALAQKNIQHNSIKNLTLIKSNLFKNLKDHKFDLIISNPPYIAEHFYEKLHLSVRNWEDKNALIAKDCGLDLIKKIIKNSNKFLNTNKDFENLNIPQLLIETDYYHPTMLLNYLKKYDFKNILILKDQFEQDRVITARR